MGTKLLFEQKFTQEECTAYSQLSAFATNSEHVPPLNFKTLILGCLDEFIADVYTDIALDHKIHIYDPRHEVCSDLVGNPEDRFAQDATHIKQRFFTICATFLYIGKKGLTINTTLVMIL